MKMTLDEDDLLEAIGLLLVKRGLEGRAENVSIGCDVIIARGKAVSIGKFYATLDFLPRDTEPK